MYGFTNFDNVGYALLTIFICTTLDGWTQIMNIHQDIYMTPVVHFYFLTVVWTCAFFVLNLTIALMLMKYEEVESRKDSDDHDSFEVELEDLGEEIF